MKVRISFENITVGGLIIEENMGSDLDFIDSTMQNVENGCV